MAALLSIRIQVTIYSGHHSHELNSTASSVSGMYLVLAKDVWFKTMHYRKCLKHDIAKRNYEVKKNKKNDIQAIAYEG